MYELKFGSQKIFDYIKNNLNRANDFLWYNELYEIIKCDVSIILSQYKLPEMDKEDIIQEVQIAVSTNLIKFVFNSEKNTTEQRNAWLRKITENRIKTYFRKKYKSMEDPFEDALLQIENNRFSFVDNNNIEQKIKEEYLQQRIVNAFSTLFSINTSPDKIMAFVFNRIIGTIECAHLNGSPKKVTEEFTGVSLKDMYEIMKHELKNISSFEFPEEVFLPLEEKIDMFTENGTIEVEFKLSPRGITDSSNWITKKITEKERNKYNESYFH